MPSCISQCFSKSKVERDREFLYGTFSSQSIFFQKKEKEKEKAEREDGTAKSKHPQRSIRK